MEKKKVFYIMISEFFPSYHPKAGEPTNFEEKIRNGEKKHTIRQNYEWWKKREEAINNGEAILSIRKWSGKPYHSKQVELFRIQKVNIQKIEWNHDLMVWQIDNNGNYIHTEELSKNDGLGLRDFSSWFHNCPDNLGCIINFGEHKY